MYDNKHKRTKTGNKKERFTVTPRILGMLARQTAAAIVCFAVVLGMNNSHNTKLKSCAASLGRAIRHNANWEETVKTAIYKIKGIALPDKNEQATPSEQKADIDFR